MTGLQPILGALAGFPRLFLLLDYDGTLVPIASTPDLALPSPRLLRTLHCLTSRETLQVAVISGRPMDELQSLLPVPGLSLAGCHGALVRTAAGETCSLLPAGWSDAVLQEIYLCLAAAVAGKEGFLLEHKGVSLALHYRLADPEESAVLLREALEWSAPFVSRGQLSVLRGNMVLELRPAGVDKGKAVLFLLERLGVPGVLPMYIGDDETDEDGFRALRGKGITVRVGSEPRTSAAAFRLENPAQVIELLEKVAAGHGAIL